MKSINIFKENKDFLKIKRLISDFINDNNKNENESFDIYGKKLISEIENHFNLSQYDIQIEEREKEGFSIEEYFINHSLVNSECQKNINKIYFLTLIKKENIDVFCLSMLEIELDLKNKKCNLLAVFKQKKDDFEVSFSIEEDLISINLEKENGVINGSIYLDDNFFIGKEFSYDYELKNKEEKSFIDFFLIKDYLFNKYITLLLDNKDFSKDEKDLLFLEEELDFFNSKGYLILMPEESLYTTKIFKK